jgi:hypothetical protein
MYAAVFILIFLVTLSSSIYAQRPKIDTPERSSDEQEIRKSIGEIAKAFVARESEPFERIYLDEYVSIRGKPIYNAKMQLVAMVKSDETAIKAGKKLDFETLLYENDEPIVHFFGNTAVVNVLKKNNWRYDKDKCLTRYQSTELWIKRNTKWRLAAGHATLLQCDQPPWHAPHPAVAAVGTENTPRPNARKDIEREIRQWITDNGSRNEAANETLGRIFAESFVYTNETGVTGTDTWACRTAYSWLTSEGKQNEDIVVFDDGAIYTYRVKKMGMGGAAGPPSIYQNTAFLVKISGQWRVIAFHCTKMD